MDYEIFSQKTVSGDKYFVKKKQMINIQSSKKQVFGIGYTPTHVSILVPFLGIVPYKSGLLFTGKNEGERKLDIWIKGRENFL